MNELQEKLDDRFSLLTKAPRDAPSRHQTLEAAINWSYQLLSPEEQILFQRLAVFQGSRSIDAVQEVCCFDLKLEAMDGLESLLSKNLLKQEEAFDGETRFYMLETLHAYAADCLKDSGEGDLIQERHTQYFVSLTEKAREPLLGGPDTMFWRRKIEADFENVRLAHDWAISRGVDDFRLSLVANLVGYWYAMGHESEGKDWTENSLRVIHLAPLPRQAWIFMSAANINFIFHKFDAAEEYWEKALGCFQLLEDDLGIARCHLGLLARGVQDLDQNEIQEHFNIVENIYSKEGNYVGLAQVWTAFGGKAVVKGDYQLADAAFEKALLFSEKSGDISWKIQCMVNLAATQVELGYAQTSRNLVLEVLRIGIGNLQNPFNDLWNL